MNLKPFHRKDLLFNGPLAKNSGLILGPQLFAKVRKCTQSTLNVQRPRFAPRFAPFPFQTRPIDTKSCYP